ncbi:MAG: citrate synthase [Pseudomonadales bacterium]|jgi:citrate synthase|nr:citrate synthase [Pseudomonadales bacterium]MDP7596972.1 citrate synthase [Pseudomonadales bacterium]HJN50848.1 citrate synthase [Pseudomonadales bacterium]|tara:strand:- start:236 stop:1525 length:1290 start_codon:yes stop_codon:yes gene_type:complete
MAENAELNLPDGQTIVLPVITGTENEKAIDISRLRAETGHITLDPGYGNTGSCASAITFLDGENGILRYRGIPIEQLCAGSSFVEVAYLVIYGKLPTQTELDKFSADLNKHALIHEDMKTFFSSFSTQAHPMAILSAMVASLSAYYTEASVEQEAENLDLNAVRLISKIRTLAAFSYKKSMGQPFIYPNDAFSYCGNFLRMMFGVPAEEYELNQDIVDALNLLLILHAEHEQNCSTATVRTVGSSHANIYASVAAGILALWGPLHGGANQQVIEMLELIRAEGGDVDKFIAKAKDPNSGFRLMGFGHRVYKNFDPRATVIKAACDRVLETLGIDDPVLEIAKKMEEHALSDEYFVKRKLYPNVDFYSGIIYRAIGIPVNMFTVMFAVGRLPGWIAQWKEMMDDPTHRITRPRQVYTGDNATDFVPIAER